MLLRDRALQMMGLVTDELTETTTHLISTKASGKKYKVIVSIAVYNDFQF